MSLVKFLSQLRDLDIHIWVENNTLRYKAPQGAITPELLAGLKERREELIHFLKQVNTYTTIEPAPKQEYYPVTSAQKRFYILSQLEGAQTGYHISGATRIEGKLDPDRLAGAFKKLVKRHEAFRTTFTFSDDELFQQIHPEAELTVDYQELDENRVPEMINRFIQPFDLSRAPLLRIKLLKIGPEKHILLYDMHHIISDLMSMSVLVREFAKLYNEENLPELPVQYKDFAFWQNNSGVEIIRQQEKYWLENFTGETHKLNLPTDYPRPEVMSFQGKAADFTLDEELTLQLRQLAVQRKTTLFMTLLAGYNLFLSRLTGVEAITVGTTVAGRRYAELQDIIGMFVNTLPLKNHPKPTQTFTEFLEEVRQNTLRTFENQDYQYEMLLDKLKIPIDLNRNPLFNTLFNPQTEFNTSNYQFEVNGLNFTPYELDSQTNTFAFDLMILLNEIGNRVQLNCVYRTSLFKRSTIEYFMNEYIRLLKEITLAPGKLLKDYRVFHPHDIRPSKHPVRITAPYREFEAAANRSIVERFEEQVRQYPGRIAAKVGSAALNYESLNRKANQVARLIREKQKGTQPVALLFGNDPDMFTGIIGVLKAGQAYLPLDPTYPKERLAYMLSDSGASLMVTDHQNVTLAAEFGKKIGKKIQVIDIGKINPKTADDNLNLAIGPEQVAYIKYTSGSTGKPKGIPQTHRNVLAFIRRYTNQLHINPEDKVALFSSYSHSAGAIDIFSMLLNGGTLYPFDLKSEGNLRKVADWLIAEGITIFHSVPMVYRYCTDSLAAGEKFSRVRLVVLGGEPILAKDAERLKRYFEKDCVLVNMFGATEVIIGTFGIVDQETEVTGAQVPVGYPVEEVKIYLLDEANREVPVFGVGEIVYESEYLALDYLNLPEKSAESYGPNPLIGEGRVFRSGDLGRMMPDGRLEFLGRKDFQVKIRGYRIELGEIEAALDNIQGIKKSIVAGFEKGEGDYYLAAYYTTTGVEPDKREMRRLLGQKLPDYMIPSYFVKLEKLPLTPNGKVDRKQLPEPEISGIDIGIHYEVPGNEVEAKLADIWRDVLGIEKVGVNDSFFDLGGHSLNATTLISRIRKIFNVEVPLREVFQTPTIKGLAKVLSKAGQSIHSNIEAAPKQDYYPVSAAQKRFYILNQIEGAQTSYNFSSAITIEGKLDQNHLTETLKKIVNRHETFRTSFELIGGELVQRIQPEMEIAVDYQELEEYQVAEVISQFIRPFDLSRAPLLRIKLLKVAEEKYILLFDMDHIISDGVSLNILMREFTAFYHGENLPELRIQYKDFAVWQNNQGTDIIQKQEKYWLEKYSKEIPKLDLPTDYPRPAVMNSQGAAFEIGLNQELTFRLKQMAVQREVTLFMIVLAGYNLLLARLTGAEEVIVGTTVAGRRHADLENIIGLFLNTLALKNHPKPQQIFREFLEEVKQNSLQAFENQDYPFETLLDKLEVPRDLSRNPLFNTLLDALNEFDTRNQFEVGGLKFAPYEFERKTTTFDLLIYIYETGNRIQFNCVYRTSLFKRSTIEYLMNEYIRLLDEIVSDPGKLLQDYKVFAPNNIRPSKYLVRITHPYKEFEAAAMNQSLVGRFEEQVKQYPGQIAVKMGATAISYESLNKWANQLARMILKEPAKPKPVALLFEHGPEMFAGIAGVLKAGRAYLPLDPTYPKERLAYMLGDSGAALLVADHQNVSLAAELSKKTGKRIHVIDVSKINPRTADDNLNLAIGPEQVAYIKYTSGSTGRPKGIPQTHRNVLAFIRRYTNELHINRDDKVALFSSYSHSAGAIDIFSMLLNGGTLYPYDLKSEGNMRKVADWLIAEGMTIFHSVPMVYRYCTESLADGEKLSGVRLVVLGGEPVLSKDVERMKRYFEKECVLVNMFGATEVIIGTFGIAGQETEITGAQVPVGYPVEEVKIYLLNEDNREVPVFGVGEIIYESEYLALDYLNLPEKNAESYGPNPLTGTGRIFRSGDLGRILPDGQLEFLGRKDFQVKIRGYRIELGEIEAALDEIPGIHKSIVAGFDKGEGDYYLAAYYTVVEGREPEKKELRRLLGQKLPDYMIPSYFVRLENLPLTPNGKINRKALPEPEVSGIDTGVDYEAPGNEIEAKLVEIWQEVLGVEKIGINDNFFDLGGHSLNATQVILKIHKELNVELPLREIFNAPVVKELAKRVTRTKGNIYSSIKPVEKREYYPVSAAQKRMYIVNQLDSSGTSYNTPAAIIIENELDKKRLENVFRTLIARHEAFRTSFKIINGEPVQKIHEMADFEIDYDKLGDGRIEKIVREFIRPFDLSKAPLLRVKLIELPQHRHVMIYDTHHIIADGTSTSILTEEFIRLYNGEELPELRIQYKDYTVWQNELLENGKIKEQEAYWSSRFADEIPVLNLPSDYPRPTVQSFEGDQLKFEIGPELALKLNRMAAETGATLYMIFLAALNILLSKYSGQEDIIIGSSIAGRSHADLEKIIGVFINTLAMRNYPARTKTFTGFLAEVKENSLKAYENQDYQFEELVEVLNLPRDLSRNPLFDVMFILQNMSGFKIEKSALKLTPYELENRTAKMDLTLTTSEVDGKLDNTLEYSTQLFTRETVERLMSSFIHILLSVLENPEIKLADIEVLTGPEKQNILEDFNRTKLEYSKEKLIHQLFTEQADKTPSAVALQYKNETLTYRELNEQANRLAGVLRGHGVKPDKPVAIIVNRSLEMIIGIMAILKAGGAYLPIDPSYPGERIKYMLEDSETGILLTQKELIAKDIPKIQFTGTVLDVNDHQLYQGSGAELEQINTARDLAYIIYTSGSTGQPKGVMIEHRAVHNFIQGIRERIDFAAGKTILALTTISFDIFGLETLLALAKGLKVVIVSENEQLDPGLLSEMLIQNRIEMLQITPSRLQLLLSDVRYQSCFEQLTEIMIGGEALSESLLKEVRKLTRAKIYNMYGPTETTIWSTVKDLTAGGGVNIGTPIANTQIYIVDDNDQLQPIGVVGELCIAGDGLARGYWKRPELTLEKFVPNPFHDSGIPITSDGFHERKSPNLNPQPDSRMYKTGDLARWLPDGNIEFLGRTDHQVKIRGYRIELGEIENRLLQHEAIHGAAVIDYSGENGLKFLAAYFVAGRELTVTELRASLEKDLPDYMIPASFIQLERIPQTPNGKIDRKALPKVEQHQSDSGVEYVPPQTVIEKQMAGIWQDLLKYDQVGVRDNFFTLGGNSLLVVLMHNRINQLYPGKVDVTDIFVYPTISRLAQFIETGEKAKMIQLEELPFPEDYFGTAAAGSKDQVFKFQIRDSSFVRLKMMAERIGAGLNDFLLAVYVYLLAEISEQQTIVVQTILTDRNQVLPVRIDMDEIADLPNLFQTVKQRYTDTSKSAIYDIEQLSKVRIVKDKFKIIPFFASGYDVTRQNLAYYDLLLNIQSVTHNEIYFTCNYNKQRLKRDAVGNLMTAYLKLIEIIMERMDLQ